MGKNATDKTLIFCTTYTPLNKQKINSDDPHDYYSWNVRYKIWLESVRRSGLTFDQILMVDDGSERLPDWPDVRIVREGEELCNYAAVVLFHFKKHLGRNSELDFPGWLRSFFFVSKYAEINNFTRIIHIESDTFLITPEATDVVNSAPEGWTGFWSSRYNRPESCIQVITGSALQTYRSFASRPIESFSGTAIETTLPFTRIERSLAGGRYGEDALNWVPKSAHWCVQARPTRLGTYSTYFWWIPWLDHTLPALDGLQRNASIVDIEDSGTSHHGRYYLDWLAGFSRVISPRIYFEIGTHVGGSLKTVSADAVCVDPNFSISGDVIGLRRSTHFFQGASDEFFGETDLVKRLLPRGVDLAFLDGLHLFENILKDFLNTERLTNPHSVILLHDCLPFNERMAECERRYGGGEEPEEIRDFWTGDVWNILLVLSKYRPELSVSYIDCTPTGIICCSNLDKTNTVISERFTEIVLEFLGLSLSYFGLERLWGLYPMFDSKKILLSFEDT